MVWKVSFPTAAEKAFGKIERPTQRRIQKFIDTRLETTQDPGGEYRFLEKSPRRDQ